MARHFRDLWGHQVQLWGSWGGVGVGDEAEAFLRGRLLQQMRRCGRRGAVPPWLWLNAVAHGDRTTVVVASGFNPLIAMVNEAGNEDLPDDTGWRQAQARIAAELLRRSQGNDELLVALQQRVLVPLELVLPDDVTPDLLVEIAVGELRRAQV